MAPFIVIGFIVRPVIVGFIAGTEIFDELNNYATEENEKWTKRK